jgi:hypothetical protein
VTVLGGKRADLRHIRLDVRQPQSHHGGEGPGRPEEQAVAFGQEALKPRLDDDVGAGALGELA